MATARQLAAMTDDALLAHLDDVCKQLEQAEKNADALRAARLRVWQEGRRREPQIKIALLAKRSKVEEVTFNKTMRKARNGA